MGRAIVRRPKVFLFDEPLSNLDAKLRVSMRSEIKRLHQRLQTTSIYVTHDQIEAMTMADQIVVMHDGQVEQIGSPLELYDRPRNRFVAGFIGSPAMNFLEGTVQLGADAHFLLDGGQRLPLPPECGAQHGQRVVYGIRPEHLRIAADGLRTEVLLVEPTGSETLVAARIGSQELMGVFRERQHIAPGDPLVLQPQADRVHLFDAQSGLRL
jgi:multiple sugar transport system ATP-binding protein